MAAIRMLKHLTPQIETLSYQFIQRCSVSGTAKGKEKIKKGETLKRSKITVKKGKIQPVPASKGSDSKKSEFDPMVDVSADGLLSIHPVRFRKLRNRANEAMRTKMLKNLTPQIEILDYRPYQWPSVSEKAKGKAKGKAKIKKRVTPSKITVKKGKPGPESKSSYSQGPQFDQMGPSPVRFLRPKEKAREAMREKMGLVSEARKLEIQNLKEHEKTFGKPWIIGTPGLDLITLGLVNANDIPKYELTAEDGMKLAKQYSRILMRKHRVKQAAKSNSLWCKREAIKALPDELKSAALVPYRYRFPAKKWCMAALTPPIEGYADRFIEAATRTAVKKKLR